MCEELIRVFSDAPNFHKCDESVPNLYTCEDSVPNFTSVKNWYQIITNDKYGFKTNTFEEPVPIPRACENVY